MRIQLFQIHKFRNLERFQIDFSNNSIAALLGRNASAKSNLIEAIVTVFNELELRSLPSFRYRIIFVCKGKSVEIDCGFTHEDEQQIRVGGVSFSYSDYIKLSSGNKITKRLMIIRDEIGGFLPNHVITYYSGLNDRAATQFKESEKIYDSKLRKNIPTPLRRLFFTNGSHCPQILMTFLCDPGEWSSKFLSDYIQLREAESVMMHINQPSWFVLKREVKNLEKESGPNYWFTGGQIYSALRIIQDAGVVLRNYPSEGEGVPPSDIFIYFNDKALKSLRLNKGGYTPYQRSKDLFHALDDLQRCGFISRIHFQLSLNKNKDFVDIDRLSEGEKQLLAVIGLIRFTKDQDSLFLLDEPDTHLNPQWSYIYRRLLEEAMEGVDSCQVIIATHDPIMVAGMVKEQVRIFKRTSSDPEIQAVPPLEDPLGMGIGKILTSQMFGLRSLLGEQTLMDLDAKRELAVKLDRTKSETDELKRLNAKLRDIDLTCIIEDPLYPLFVNCVVKHPDYAHLKSFFLSDGDFERQRKIAETFTRNFIDFAGKNIL